MTLLRVALFVASLALTAATNVEDCGSTATINLVTVSGCDVPPCVVHRGTNVTADLEMTINEASPTLTAKITGTIFGIEIPWTGTDPNACDDLTEGQCPLTVGEKCHYSTYIYIKPEYPSVDVLIKFKLIAESGKTAACFVVPASVK